MDSSEELSSMMNRLTGGLITAMLIALILWIGQTTFHHAATLASLEEKLNDVKHQFESVDQRQDGLRKQLENVASEAKDNGRLQFTARDGDAISSHVRQAEQSITDIDRKFVERLNGLELRLATLETQHQHSQEVAALQSEITQLRNDIIHATAVQEPQSPQPQNSDRFARGLPVFLPPIDNRR